MVRLKKSKLFISVFLLFLLLTGVIGYTIYSWINGPNVKITNDQIIYLPTGSSFEDLMDILDSNAILANKTSFRRVAKWMKYGDKNIKSGKYTIKSNWSNRELIQVLRGARQTPVNLIINNVRTLKEAAGQIANQIELDSATLIEIIYHDTILEKYHLTAENMLSMFIPNTYQLYWNISGQKLLDRLKMEHDKYWQQDDRMVKARAINLSQAEVYTLASIVEKETQAKSERPTVAGLYLNRLKHKMPLQADPTVVFANAQFDLRRVLNKHLEIESPYNTYKYPGLPPGPIYMPSMESLDAVLNAEEHDYLYMCARPDNSGLHAFASSLSGHAVNADRYRRWLNERGIR